MALYVGQKVVCVDASLNSNLSHGWGTEEYPAKGVIYTIRDLEPHPCSGVTPCCRVEEIRNAILPYYDKEIGAVLWELSLRQNRFRPVKATDISVFTQMLAPKSRTKEPA